jgi:hypothetical protein
MFYSTNPLFVVYPSGSQSSNSVQSFCVFLLSLIHYITKGISIRQPELEFGAIICVLLQSVQFSSFFLEVAADGSYTHARLSDDGLDAHVPPTSG